MKTAKSIKGIAGLSQEEAALLFKVTKSQVGMYVTGKRSLPMPATIQLAGILHHLHNTKDATQSISDIQEKEKKITADWLLKEQKKHHYKQLLAEKKITAMENKRAECFTALEVLQYLETQPGHDAMLLKSIKARVQSTLNKNAMHHLEELQLKKEQAEIARMKIEEKIKQI